MDLESCCHQVILNFAGCKGLDSNLGNGLILVRSTIEACERDTSIVTNVP
jgi:hypothetical protein